MKFNDTKLSIIDKYYRYYFQILYLFILLNNALEEKFLISISETINGTILHNIDLSTKNK